MIAVAIVIRPYELHPQLSDLIPLRYLMGQLSVARTPKTPYWIVDNVSGLAKQ